MASARAGGAAKTPAIHAATTPTRQAASTNAGLIDSIPLVLTIFVVSFKNRRSGVATRDAQEKLSVLYFSYYSIYINYLIFNRNQSTMLCNFCDITNNFQIPINIPAIERLNERICLAVDYSLYDGQQCLSGALKRVLNAACTICSRHAYQTLFSWHNLTGHVNACGNSIAKLLTMWSMQWYTQRILIRWSIERRSICQEDDDEF